MLPYVLFLNIFNFSAVISMFKYIAVLFNCFYIFIVTVFECFENKIDLP